MYVSHVVSHGFMQYIFYKNVVKTIEDVPELIPVRMLTQYAYCKRLSYMEWVQGEFEYNTEVAEGKYEHRNVDKSSEKRKVVDGDEEKIHTRSITLSDAKIGLVAKMDLLEVSGSHATPVEYKHGNTPDTAERTHLDHRIQVCAQGLLLRANGYECTKGIVYYVSSKQRVEVSFDDRMVAETLQMIHNMKETMTLGSMPPPLVDSPKCPRCSLVGICMPDETNMLSDVKSTSTGKENVRRMYPMRDDAVPVYVQEQGARVTKSGDCIHVKIDGQTVRKIRLIDISEITLFGNVQITTQTVRELCNRNIPICYMTYGGWFTGMTAGMAHKNIELRMAQHKKHLANNMRMEIARNIVYGKIKNCATLLRRNHNGSPEKTLGRLDELADQARHARRYDALLGIEGMAARVYFAEFNGMIKDKSVIFEFTERNRRPPRDPINALLSFLYSVLTRHAMVTASRVGLDPYLGFLHMPKYGRPALALDLIEEFRPLVADSVCITVINGGEVTEKDVIKTKFGVNMTSSGRQTVIAAYERRMDATVKHPSLGYSASYRRIMETQARLLSRHLLDEIPSYPAFRTR